MSNDPPQEINWSDEELLDLIDDDVVMDDESTDDSLAPQLQADEALAHQLQAEEEAKSTRAPLIFIHENPLPQGSQTIRAARSRALDEHLEQIYDVDQFIANALQEVEDTKNARDVAGPGSDGFRSNLQLESNTRDQLSDLQYQSRDMIAQLRGEPDERYIRYRRPDRRRQTSEEREREEQLMAYDEASRAPRTRRIDSLWDEIDDDMALDMEEPGPAERPAKPAQSNIAPSPPSPPPSSSSSSSDMRPPCLRHTDWFSLPRKLPMNLNMDRIYTDYLLAPEFIHDVNQMLDGMKNLGPKKRSRLQRTFCDYPGNVGRSITFGTDAWSNSWFVDINDPVTQLYKPRQKLKDDDKKWIKEVERKQSAALHAPSQGPTDHLLKRLSSPERKKLFDELRESLRIEHELRTSLRTQNELTEMQRPSNPTPPASGPRLRLTLTQRDRRSTSESKPASAPRGRAPTPSTLAEIQCKMEDKRIWDNYEQKERAAQSDNLTLSLAEVANQKAQEYATLAEVNVDRARRGYDLVPRLRQKRFTPKDPAKRSSEHKYHKLADVIQKDKNAFMPQPSPDRRSTSAPPTPRKIHTKIEKWQVDPDAHWETAKERIAISPPSGSPLPDEDELEDDPWRFPHDLLRTVKQQRAAKSKALKDLDPDDLMEMLHEIGESEKAPKYVAERVVAEAPQPASPLKRKGKGSDDGLEAYASPPKKAKPGDEDEDRDRDEGEDEEMEDGEISE